MPDFAFNKKIVLYIFYKYFCQDIMIICVSVEKTFLNFY